MAADADFEKFVPNPSNPDPAGMHNTEDPVSKISEDDLLAMKPMPMAPNPSPFKMGPLGSK